MHSSARFALTLDQRALLEAACSRAGTDAIGKLLELDRRTLRAALGGARLNLPSRAAILRAIDQRLL
jgi:hypothetical protein